MLPDEELLLSKKTGKARERLARALETLDRIRGAHPGVDLLSGFPPEARAEAKQAIAEVRRSHPRNPFVELLLAGTVLLGLGLFVLEPFHVFRTAADGEGHALCHISERILGVVPWSERDVQGVAASTFSSWEPSRDARGNTQGSGESLRLDDAEGRKLATFVGSQNVGASLEAVDRDIHTVLDGKSAPAAAVHWNVSLLPFLFGSLVVLLLTGHVVGTVGMALLDRGLLPEVVFRLLVVRTPTLGVLAALGFAWGVALAGTAPPPVLVELLHLS